MKTSLVFAAALALALAGCNKSTRSNDTVTNDTAANTAQTSTQASTYGNATTSSDINRDLNHAANSASAAIGSAATNVATSARMAQWKLTASDIQADLDNRREIVRTKDENVGAATATNDKSVIESMVKGRLEADSDIAALKIKVDADKHGDVTLKGKARSAEEVGRAIALALDTEGVTKVTSKIKLDKDAER
jgi:osmotically-inducible protein OsmY